MTRLVLIPLPANEELAAKLAQRLNAEVFVPEVRAFPDGETYLRLDRDLHGRKVALVCTMDRPNPKFLSLLFAARTVTDLGAASVGLVAPYLAYMRQDRRFQAGEAITSKLFASFLSPHFDWLVTVDPHLHRIHRLSDVYDLPTRVVHAAPVIAQWIAREVSKPLLIGPDSESVQWVNEVAQTTGAAVVVLEKERRGDEVIESLASDVSNWRGHTPVLVDDIISTGHTMIETLAQLRRAEMSSAICIGVHGIFAPGAYENLIASGAARIVTTDTVRHVSNTIEISALLTDGIQEIMN
jgi:ribose-phosphate pyrophosphokinase